jgi:hypothetical protein
MTEVNFLVKKGLTVPKGSASTPSVIFDASDPNTGLYSPGADQVAVATNGTGRLFVDASGRIGIAGSPSASSNTYLQVGYAGIGSDHVAYNYDSYFANNLYKSANSAWSRISTRAGGLLRIEDDTFTYSTADSGTAGASATLSERLRITSAGLVGIGTSSPATGDYIDESAPFTVGDSTAGGMRLFFGINNTSNYGYIGSVESATAYRSLVLQPGGGNVGIGTTSPSRLLHLSAADSTSFSSADFDQTYNFLRIVNTTNDKAAGIYFGIGTNGEAAITATETTDGETSLVFGTRGGGTRSERARLDHAGRLLVGTSTIDSSGRLLVGTSTSAYWWRCPVLKIGC